jgi:hypothetical protein
MGRIKKCEEMEHHIGAIFAAILSRVFFLHLRNSDIRAARRLQSSGTGDQPDFSLSVSNLALAAPEQTLPFPPERAATVFNSHPVVFAHFFSQIVGEWDRCFDRIAPTSGSGSWFLDQSVERVHEIILCTADLMCDNFVIGEQLGRGRRTEQ